MDSDIVAIILNSILTVIIIAYGVKKYISTKNKIVIWVSCGFGIVSFSYIGLMWEQMGNINMRGMGFFLVYIFILLGYILIANGLSKAKIE